MIVMYDTINIIRPESVSANLFTVKFDISISLKNHLHTYYVLYGHLPVSKCHTILKVLRGYTGHTVLAVS